MLDFLQPLELKNIKSDNNEWTNFQLGKHTTFNDGTPFDVSEFQLAIIGIEEDRNSIGNIGCGLAAEEIRKELYQLYTHFKMPKLIDLGDVIKGKTVKDSQVALTEILKILFQHKITVMIIGGGHDLTYGQFMAYKNQLHSVEMVVVDEKIDILESSEVNSLSFLWHILNQEDYFLDKITHLGQQMFYNSPKSVDVLESLNHQVLRLGEVRKSVIEVEPFLRSADILSMDLSAIKSSECPANAVTSPNGFLGEEACQISRFAGFSNKVSSFGLYEMNPLFDSNKQGAKQASQILWYFIEGFSGRRADFPSEEDKNFVQYFVTLESADTEINFWKSTFSNRWWMEIPQKGGEIKYLPCSYTDYQTALKDELPDKWMRAYTNLG